MGIVDGKICASCKHYDPVAVVLKETPLGQLVWGICHLPGDADLPEGKELMLMGGGPYGEGGGPLYVRPEFCCDGHERGTP